MNLSRAWQTPQAGALIPPADYIYQIEQRQTHDDETDSFIEIEGTLSLRRKA